MAARQTASRGRGAMGSPSPSASSENGSQTALAKSPPRWARPTTACWAPFMPPGSGAIKATAATMRTISQAPKPKRPSRAVSRVPATVCQTSRNPASASTPPLKTNSMSPSTELRPAPISPRKASTSRVALSAPANRPRSMVCAAAGSASSSPAIPVAASTVPASRIRRPIQERARFLSDNRNLFAFGVLATASSFPVSCVTFGAELAGTGSRNGHILRTSSAEDRTASVSGRVNSGANRKRSALMAVSSLRQPGWRGRAEGACLRQPTPAQWRRWRRAVRRAGNGASRASAIPLAG